MVPRETAEFLYQGEIPFALASCKKFEAQPVLGYYNEEQQIWQGSKDIAGLTLTLTATPGDNDQDQD